MVEGLEISFILLTLKSQQTKRVGNKSSKQEARVSGLYYEQDLQQSYDT